MSFEWNAIKYQNKFKVSRSKEQVKWELGKKVGKTGDLTNINGKVKVNEQV